MGHYKTVYVKKIDEQVQAYITKCQNLLLTLGRLESRAMSHHVRAEEGVRECAEQVLVETDNLSGVYFENYYLPYRDKLFKETDALNLGDTEMLNSLRQQIEKLELIIEEKKQHLFYDAEEQIWVEDLAQ